MYVIHRTELQVLARTRLREAEALFAAGLYDGAVYLCGYVVEMALKACVCKTLDLAEYPDTEQGARQIFRTHDFALLELLAGLRARVIDQSRESVLFRQNWSLVADWKVDFRYSSSRTQAEAHAMLEALRSRPEGVLTWLSQQW